MFKYKTNDNIFKAAKKLIQNKQSFYIINKYDGCKYYDVNKCIYNIKSVYTFIKFAENAFDCECELIVNVDEKYVIEYFNNKYCNK